MPSTSEAWKPDASNWDQEFLDLASASDGEPGGGSSAGEGEQEQEEDEVFYVEKVIDMMRDPEGGYWVYRVKWQGYPDLTWEPVQNFDGADPEQTYRPKKKMLSRVIKATKSEENRALRVLRAVGWDYERAVAKLSPAGSPVPRAAGQPADPWQRPPAAWVVSPAEARQPQHSAAAAAPRVSRVTAHRQSTDSSGDTLYEVEWALPPGRPRQVGERFLPVRLI